MPMSSPHPLKDVNGNLYGGAGSGAALETGATDNILFGDAAGAGLTTAQESILIGNNVGPSITDDNGMIIIGHNSDFNAADTAAVAAGVLIANDVDVAGCDNSVAIGGNISTGGTGGYINQAVVIGFNAAKDMNGVQQSVIIGYNAGTYLGAATAANVVIGLSAAQTTVVQNAFTNNVAIGYAAMTPPGGGQQNNFNVAIGSVSMSNGQNTSSVAIGYDAMGGAGNGGYNRCVAIGEATLLSGSVGSTGQIAIGYHAGQYSYASYSIAIGYQAGLYFQGAYNIALGYNAADAVSTGTHNIAAGQNALGVLSTGSYNVGIGSLSLQQISATGANNTAVGYAAGAYQAGTLSNITAIGSNAASTAGNRGEFIALGNNTLKAAIFVDTTAGNHVISFFDNYTGFSDGSGVLELPNATTVPTTNSTIGGTLYASAGGLYWRGSAGTVTNIAPA